MSLDGYDLLILDLLEASVAINVLRIMVINPHILPS